MSTKPRPGYSRRERRPRRTHIMLGDKTGCGRSPEDPAVVDWIVETKAETTCVACLVKIKQQEG